MVRTYNFGVFVAFFLCYKCMNNLALLAGAKRKCPIMGPSQVGQVVAAAA